ncbi:hypothetical protein OsJ_24869 [Oryza sativa Japonica Group]|uniref:Uncharacterized protein n=1 Tax=Oryza sativa subsp. japonica TaxID=39947 RepID=Q8LI22_ORYSJ|nr:hypothetical protein OsJ_24869 [Oryza sativa Japonica Group]BAC07084.1 hypothetical protein [Oryza sativa Japonica Group]
MAEPKTAIDKELVESDTKASTSRGKCYRCRACRLATQQLRLQSYHIIVAKGIEENEQDTECPL